MSRLIALAALGALIVGPALAGSPGPKPRATQTAAAAMSPCAAQGLSENCLLVYIDHLEQVRLERAVSTVLIGNPAIAEVNMIGHDHAVVTARSIGSTNILFLDNTGALIAEFDVYIREVSQNRVVMRRGPTEVSLYQCAPRCERSMSPLDTAEPHKAITETISRETQIAEGGLQGGGDDLAGSIDELTQ